MNKMSHHVYWDEVEDRFLSQWVSSPRLFVFWPDRVNADVCFEKAGFQRWSDGVERDEEKFGQLVWKLVDLLTTMGEPILREGQPPRVVRRFWEILCFRWWGKNSMSPRPSAINALIAAGEDDQFPPCVVTFGTPPVAALGTAEGHNLIWVRLAGDQRSEALFSAVARAHTLTRFPLNWSVLRVGQVPKHCG